MHLETTLVSNRNRAFDSIPQQLAQGFGFTLDDRYTNQHPPDIQLGFHKRISNRPALGVGYRPASQLRIQPRVVQRRKQRRFTVYRPLAMPVRSNGAQNRQQVCHITAINRSKQHFQPSRAAKCFANFVTCGIIDVHIRNANATNGSSIAAPIALESIPSG